MLLLSDLCTNDSGKSGRIEPTINTICIFQILPTVLFLNHISDINIADAYKAETGDQPGQYTARLHLIKTGTDFSGNIACFIQD